MALPHRPKRSHDRSSGSAKVVVAAALVVIVLVLGYFVLREPARINDASGLRMSVPTR